ncbi:hypothetical protein Tco_0271919 [Tanacetum coccineum]
MQVARDRQKRATADVRCEVVFPSSKFDGTPREVLSSHGNAKISSEKSIRTSSQKPHPRKMPHLEPWDKALLTGGDCNISHFQVMAASTIPVSAEENLGDPIDIRIDIIHPEPVAAVTFPAAAIMRTQAQHGEAIQGIQEHLLGVPVQEDLTALRFRADIAEAKNASLRARIKTTEAIGKITS